MPAIKKCADDWLCEPLYRNTLIMDPDGWDRRDFERSWAEEITEEEFQRRLMGSTCISRPHPR